jgi:hypothetical protein
MRKTLTAGLTGALALCVAAVASAQGPQQQNAYRVTASVSPANAGSKSRPVPIGVRFGFEVSEASGLRPSPVRTYSIRFAGLRANTHLFPRCSTRTLEERKTVDACPRGSIIGTGYIENATGDRANLADRSIQCNAQLWVVNGGRDRANIFVAGRSTATDPRTRCAVDLASPIPARFVTTRTDGRIEFTVPESLRHPLGTLDNAVVRVTATIRRVTRRGRGFFESAGGCRAGQRRISVVFTAETGERRTASTQARCRR